MPRQPGVAQLAPTADQAPAASPRILKKRHFLRTGEPSTSVLMMGHDTAAERDDAGAAELRLRACARRTAARRGSSRPSVVDVTRPDAETVARLGRLVADMADGHVVRWSQMRSRGISRGQLRGLVDKGQLEQVAHDMYRLAAVPVPGRAHWDEITARYPEHCFCLFSAARHHGLTGNMDGRTWVALPLGAKPIDGTVRAVQWPRTGSDGKPHRMWQVGIEVVTDGPRSYRVTGAARTVVDLYRWRHRVEDGSRVFLECLGEYARQGKDRAELRAVAKQFGVFDEIREHLTAWAEHTNRF